MVMADGLHEYPHPPAPAVPAHAADRAPCWAAALPRKRALMAAGPAPRRPAA